MIPELLPQYTNSSKPTITIIDGALAYATPGLPPRGRYLDWVSPSPFHALSIRQLEIYRLHFPNSLAAKALVAN